MEIEKFSLYSQTLTPTQIMQTLSSFYGAYNEIIKKYSLVIKIKLIGDD
jgi:guanylate cyclase